tara:strand:- start:4553 stop:7054 length:2502 start_codon:yes stop_codon:yes gene_type:complete
MAIDKAATPFLPEEFDDSPITVEILPDVDEELMEFFGEDDVEVEVAEFGDNLADFIEEGELQALASDLKAGFDADKASRRDWERTYVEGLNLLGLKFEDRTKPWAGASGVFHPLLTEAIVRFQAQTIQEVFPASGPVKTTIVGRESKEKLAQAVRVANYMNYLTTKKMVEYRDETERLLFSLPISGSAFRKVYYDPNRGRPAAVFVPAEDFVVSYNTTSLETCPRATHIMRKTPNEVRKLQVSGWYSDIDLPSPTPDSNEIRDKIESITGQEESYSFDGCHTLLEMLVELDVPGYEDMDEYGEPTGVELPYVVTLDKSTTTILSIRRNWKEEDELKLKRNHYSHYQYLPGLGFYGFGLVHMIGGLTKSATSILRQLIDAGTLSNLPGGLKTRGLKIKGDDSPIEPGEFRDVDVPMGAIKDNITFLPYKEPSNVLYQLLGDLVQTGRQFASSADVKASDIDGEAPVGTTLAILEREMKVMSAIQARVHAAMGKELVMLAGIVADYGPEAYPYEMDSQETVTADFDDRIDIIPVSDPNAGTMAQRIMQYQAALQLSASAPQIYDIPFLHRQMLLVLGIQDAERIVPLEDDMLPVDPVSENMAIITGKPVKSFLYQDHEAHIQTHMAAIENPDIAEMLAKAPNAQAVQAQMSAHIAEHLAFAYRGKIEQELGVQLPGPDEALPEDIELRLSQLVAPAAAQLTGKAQKMKKAEQDAEQQKDPIVQQRERELTLKEMEAEGKLKQQAESLMNDYRKSQDRNLLERDKLEGRNLLERDKMDSAERQKQIELGVSLATNLLKASSEGDKLSSLENIKGLEIGLAIAKDAMDDGTLNQSNQ